MATSTGKAHPQGLLATQRKDAWWVQPVVTFVVLAAFVVYANVRVFENAHYSALQDGLEYHTPFGSPDFTGFVPGFLLSTPLVGPFFAYPAVLILPFVAGFRFTCYYYRKAYYRSFALRPAGCAVEAAKGRQYQGERRLFIIQNLHRYFFYAALVVLAFNYVDFVIGIVTPGKSGLHFGVGNAVMLLNVVLLSGYTLGCHSFRHLIGGGIDCYSCTAVARTRYNLWTKITFLNQRHMLWAWMSLMWVALTDLYIRYLSVSGATTLWGLPA